MGNIYSPTPVETTDNTNTSQGDGINTMSSTENNPDNTTEITSRTSYRSRSLR